ncbi:MAG TPA: cell division protein FtsL [Kofleriaceae bacterium]|nr:cell division protein FtsL [Kofleriaceae bacterium]
MRARVARMQAHVTRARAQVKSHPRAAVAGLVALAALTTALGLRQVAHRREVVSLGYALSTDTAELRRLDEQARRLRLEKSVLTSPARIEHLAAGLGMVRPAPEQVRIVWRAPAAIARARAEAP